jgi:hypothetical protein
VGSAQLRPLSEDCGLPGCGDINHSKTLMLCNPSAPFPFSANGVRLPLSERSWREGDTAGFQGSLPALTTTIAAWAHAAA